MFKPPYDWAAVEEKQSDGDMTLLVVVDSSDREAIEVATQAVFPALIHLGMPYVIHDRAAGPLAVDQIMSHRAVLLAQEGLSRGLSGEEERALQECLESGTGIVSFDSELPLRCTGLCAALGISAGGDLGQCASIQTVTNDEYVTHTRSTKETLPLIQPVEIWSVVADGAGHCVPLTDEQGTPVLVTGHLGVGRFVHFCVSPRIWLNDYLGHANGLDDVFWRSIVWAARKPFVMKAMPPYVTARLDDCQGVGGLWWNVQQCLIREPRPIPEPIERMLCELIPGSSSAAYRFAYIDVLNRHGIIPNVGVFCDQVSSEDWPILKRYYDADKAEFSIHAFSEHTDYDRYRVTKFFYHDGWHLATDGTDVINEYTMDEMAHHFRQVDQLWENVGIQPSRVVNSHYTNPGVNSLPFLKARGQDMMMLGSSFGVMYEAHFREVWSRAPYGSIGMIFDYLPVPDGVPGVKAGDFFNVEAHAYDAYQLATTGSTDDGSIDFTERGTTMKNCWRDDNDLDAAAEGVVRQVKIGLDSMFFGCIMAHEQGLAVLTVPELDEILDISDRALRRHDQLFASYDHIAEYAKCKVDSHIERIDEHRVGVACRLSGRTTLPLKLYLFEDQDDGCRYRFCEVPAFSGGLDTTFG